MYIYVYIYIYTHKYLYGTKQRIAAWNSSQTTFARGATVKSTSRVPIDCKTQN